MSETEIARLTAMLDAVNRRMDRIEASIERTQATLSERDDELHVLLRDLSLIKERLEMKLERVTQELAAVRTRQNDMHEEHRNIMAQLKNMTLVFGAARWFLAAAIPIMLSGAVSMWFKLGVP